jgi:hypothetical protein
MSGNMNAGGVNRPPGNYAGGSVPGSDYSLTGGPGNLGLLQPGAWAGGTPGFDMTGGGMVPGASQTPVSGPGYSLTGRSPRMSPLAAFNTDSNYRY